MTTFSEVAQSERVPTAKPDFASAPDLPALYDMLDQIKVKNGWNKPTPSLYPEPKQNFVPAAWRYAEARPALQAAGRLVDTKWAERRNLILANPVPGNDYPTVTSLVAAYQMVKGGESARSHRHTPNAMRVVVEAGAQTYTIVDGVKVPMEPGDVLLTPNWSYHGHDNRSDQDAYWIDILDAPLVQLLGPMFFEHHPDMVENSDVVKSHSPMRFAYREYSENLRSAPEVAPNVRQMELGPATLDTFDRVVMSISAGARWLQPRTTASQIYVVVQGSGRSEIGAGTFAWERGDVIAAPSWLAQTHEADEDALLVRMSDAPVMRMLNWLR